MGIHQADAGLFTTLGIPLAAGRTFTASESAPVALVSRSLAERLGGAEIAVGRAITFPPNPMAEVTGTFRIVGVVENVAYDGLAEQGTRRVIRDADGADPRRPLGRVRAAVAVCGRDRVVRRGVQRIGRVAD